MDPVKPFLSDPHSWATIGSGRGGEYAWFEKEAEVGHAWGRHLPHWRQSGVVYFTTFRTEDSIPAPVLQAWQRERAQWLELHPPPHDEPTQRAYHRRFTVRMHRYLDDCHGSCPMRDPVARKIIVDVLLHEDGKEGTEGYALDAFAVMPNHVHALVCPNRGASMSEIGKTWRRVSSHHLSKHLGRHGIFWQHEGWDHIVRSPRHLDRFRRYIWENPKHLPKL